MIKNTAPLGARWKWTCEKCGEKRSPLTLCLKCDIPKIHNPLKLTPGVTYCNILILHDNGSEEISQKYVDIADVPPHTPYRIIGVAVDNHSIQSSLDKRVYMNGRVLGR